MRQLSNDFKASLSGQTAYSIRKLDPLDYFINRPILVTQHVHCSSTLFTHEFENRIFDRNVNSLMNSQHWIIRHENDEQLVAPRKLSSSPNNEFIIIIIPSAPW